MVIQFNNSYCCSGLQEIWATVDVLQGTSENIAMTEDILGDVFQAAKLNKAMKDFVKVGISLVRVSAKDISIALKDREGAWRPLTKKESDEQMDEMGFVESRPSAAICTRHLVENVFSTGIMMPSADAKTCVDKWNAKVSKVY